MEAEASPSTSVECSSLSSSCHHNQAGYFVELTSHQLVYQKELAKPKASHKKQPWRRQVDKQLHGQPWESGQPIPSPHNNRPESLLLTVDDGSADPNHRHHHCTTCGIMAALKANNKHRSPAHYASSPLFSPLLLLFLALLSSALLPAPISAQVILQAHPERWGTGSVDIGSSQPASSNHHNKMMSGSRAVGGDAMLLASSGGGEESPDSPRNHLRSIHRLDSASPTTRQSAAVTHRRDQKDPLPLPPPGVNHKQQQPGSQQQQQQQFHNLPRAGSRRKAPTAVPPPARSQQPQQAQPTIPSSSSSNIPLKEEPSHHHHQANSPDSLKSLPRQRAEVAAATTSPRQLAPASTITDYRSLYKVRPIADSELRRQQQPQERVQPSEWVAGSSSSPEYDSPMGNSGPSNTGGKSGQGVLIGGAPSATSSTTSSRQRNNGKEVNIAEKLRQRFEQIEARRRKLSPLLQNPNGLSNKTHSPYERMRLMAHAHNGTSNGGANAQALSGIVPVMVSASTTPLWHPSSSAARATTPTFVVNHGDISALSGSTTAATPHSTTSVRPTPASSSSTTSRIMWVIEDHSEKRRTPLPHSQNGSSTPATELDGGSQPTAKHDKGGNARAFSYRILQQQRLLHAATPQQMTRALAAAAPGLTASLASQGLQTRSKLTGSKLGWRAGGSRIINGPVLEPPKGSRRNKDSGESLDSGTAGDIGEERLVRLNLGAEENDGGNGGALERIGGSLRTHEKEELVVASSSPADTKSSSEGDDEKASAAESHHHRRAMVVEKKFHLTHPNRVSYRPRLRVRRPGQYASFPDAESQPVSPARQEVEKAQLPPPTSEGGLSVNRVQDRRFPARLVQPPPTAATFPPDASTNVEEVLQQRRQRVQGVPQFPAAQQPSGRVRLPGAVANWREGPPQAAAHGTDSSSQLPYQSRPRLPLPPASDVEEMHGSVGEQPPQPWPPQAPPSASGPQPLPQAPPQSESPAAAHQNAAPSPFAVEEGPAAPPAPVATTRAPSPPSSNPSEDSGLGFGGSGDIGTPPPGFHEAFGLNGADGMSFTAALGPGETKPPAATTPATKPTVRITPEPPSVEDKPSAFVIPENSGLRPVQPPKEFQSGGFGSSGKGGGSSPFHPASSIYTGGDHGRSLQVEPPPSKPFVTEQQGQSQAGGNAGSESEIFTGESAFNLGKRKPDSDGYGPVVYKGVALPPVEGEGPTKPLGRGGGVAGLQPPRPVPAGPPLVGGGAMHMRPVGGIDASDTIFNQASTVKPSALLNILNRADEGFNQVMTNFEQGTPIETAAIDLLEVALGSQKLDSQAKLLSHVDRTIGLDNLQRLQRWANTGGALDLFKEQLAKIAKNYKPPPSVEAFTLPPQLEYLFHGGG